MEYKYPVPSIVWTNGKSSDCVYNSHKKSYEDIDLIKIEKAKLQAMQEDKLPFPKLLEKLRKETAKTTHGIPREFDYWESKFNRCEQYDMYNDPYKVVVRQPWSEHYTWYGYYREIYYGSLSNYWYNALGIDRKPEPLVESKSEPCRLIAYL